MSRDSTNQGIPLVYISKSSNVNSVDEQYVDVNVNPMISSSLSRPQFDGNKKVSSSTHSSASAQDTNVIAPSGMAVSMTNLRGMENFNYRSATNVSFIPATKHSSSTDLDKSGKQTKSDNDNDNASTDNRQDEFLAEKESYFNYKGRALVRCPENISKIGSLQAHQASFHANRKETTQNDIESLQDDSQARIERLKQFDEAFKNQADPIQYDGDFEGCLFPDEEVTAVIECSQISGLPTYTSDVVIHGSSKLALTYSPSSGEVRLLFSVLAESTSINVEETFVGNVIEKGFRCCFVNCKTCYRVLPTWITCFFCCDCFKLYQVAKSSAQIMYNSTSTSTQQFFSVPVGPCLLDAVAYRERTNVLDAIHGSDGMSVALSKLTCLEKIWMFILSCWNEMKGCCLSFLGFFNCCFAGAAFYCGCLSSAAFIERRNTLDARQEDIESRTTIEEVGDVVERLSRTSSNASLTSSTDKEPGASKSNANNTASGNTDSTTRSKNASEQDNACKTINTNKSNESSDASIIHIADDEDSLEGVNLTCWEKTEIGVLYFLFEIESCWKSFLTCIAPCCGRFDNETVRNVQFVASETIIRGDESEFDALLDQESQTGDIGFKISSVDEDEIYILIHYQSLLDFQNRTCKVKLARHKDKSHTELFKMAKRFVSTMSCNRNEYVKGRLWSQEMKPYEVQAIEGAKPGRLDELRKKKKNAAKKKALGKLGIY